MSNQTNKDISNRIDNTRGTAADNQVRPSKQPSSQLKLPWEGSNAKVYSADNEVFFTPSVIEPQRWNKFYPYRFLVVDIANGNKVVSSGERGIVTRTGYDKVSGQTGVSYVIAQQARPATWEMVLPITPQQLQITDQFAINTTATMRGIVEEHNGVRFKNITMSGTTGIWPFKPSVGNKIERPGSLGVIFGGTINAANNLTQSFRDVKSALTGEHPNRQDDVQGPGEDGVGGLDSTGYYQALYLGQFLERYSQAKKLPDWRNYRLVLDIPKQNQSFVVTPVQFTLSQSEQRPQEFMFTLQLRAWKRIDLGKDSAEAAFSELPDLSDPNTFQRILATIDATRSALASVTNLVQAVRSDFRGIYNGLRQISLLVRDVGGTVFAIADMPNALVRDFNSAVSAISDDLRQAFQPPTSLYQGNVSKENERVVRKFTDTVGLTTSSKAGATARSIVESTDINEGLSAEQVASGALGQDAVDRQSVDPINNIFENPEQNYDLFSQIDVDSLQLSQEQQVAIDDELERVRQITISDLRDIRQDLLDLSNEITDNFGAGDQTYADTFGLPTPRERALPLTVEENEILAHIFESIQAIDLLTATKQFDDLDQVDSLAFVGGLANENDIDFIEFPSKIPQPVPFGLTIEEIAARYMGDSNRWVEIVTTNKLRSPYIDEDGYTYSLISNADGRRFNVDDSEERLYIGQTITLRADNVPAFTRKITNVEKISDNNYLVTVDGLDNLDNLTTGNNASMQGYLPGTVNSQNQIYIPVDEPSETDDRTFTIPDVSDNRLAKISKVDFLLTDQFDVAINSVGDFRLAAGLNNLVQALKLKIRTQKGTLLRHLDYGLGLQHGTSVADIENGIIIEELNNMIADDPRFQTVENVELTLRGSTLLIDMVIRLAGGTGVLPINFDIRVS